MIGAMACARSICCTLKFETPIQRTLPSSLSRPVGPAFFDIFVGLRPVNLVEIDRVDVKTAQAVFAFAAHRSPL